VCTYIHKAVVFRFVGFFFFLFFFFFSFLLLPRSPDPGNGRIKQLVYVACFSPKRVRRQAASLCSRLTILDSAWMLTAVRTRGERIEWSWHVPHTYIRSCAVIMSVGAVRRASEICRVPNTDHVLVSGGIQGNRTASSDAPTPCDSARCFIFV
jgi:hypothetical protein